jgi:hypothetical protein
MRRERRSQSQNYIQNLIMGQYYKYTHKGDIFRREHLEGLFSSTQVYFMIRKPCQLVTNEHVNFSIKLERRDFPLHKQVIGDVESGNKKSS